MSNFARRTFAFRLFQIWEVFVFSAAFISGIRVLENLGLWDTSNSPVSAQIALLAAMSVLWSLLIHQFELYSSRRLVKRSNELIGVLSVILIAAGMLAVVGALLQFPTNQSAFLSRFLLVAIALMVGGRLLSRAFLHAARMRSRNLRFVAVAGAGKEGQRLSRKLTGKPTNGFELIGLFDDQPYLDSLGNEFPKGGTFTDLKRHLMKEPVDEVLIALPMESNYDTIMDLLEYCERVGVSARVMNEFVNHTCSDVSLEFIDGTPSLQFSREKNWGWQGKAKVIIDWTLASLALLGLMPMLLLVAVLIKLDSPGPVLFSQTRVGKNKKHFRLFKFRTMVQNAEAMQAQLESLNEAAGPVFKMRADPRVTKLGHFLRRTSIDELPQLINVMLGDMSLVGPRPLPLRDVQLFEHDWYSRRFSVRPGLTCSWVMAGRSELEFDDWVQLDLDYIDHWSLSKDVSICLNTIPRVLLGSGAY